jgi:hypothetical protein
LIFEDDVRFSRVDTGQIQQIAKELAQHNWDIVYFGYLAPQGVPAEQPLVPWNGPTTGGHFYGVTGKFIADMSQYMHACMTRPPGHPDGGPMFRDGAYNHVRGVMHDIRIFLSVPNLARQRSSRTDLHSLRFYDRIKPLAPMLAALRAAKDRCQEWKKTSA